MTNRIHELLNFWFKEHGPSDWYAQNDEFDNLIRSKFLGLHELATSGGLTSWRSSPEGQLAEIIILDQFSRNLFRGRAEAFAWDELALSLAKQAVGEGADQKLSKQMRAFFYLPYMHSETLEDHNEAMKLFKALGQEENLKFEMLHRDIIQRFGRYPYRNGVLGRTSTPEEKAFLADPSEPF
jgi:uncharacterized protein (DUF924 family)